jgi:hypothetical protein
MGSVLIIGADCGQKAERKRRSTPRKILHTLRMPAATVHLRTIRSLLGVFSLKFGEVDWGDIKCFFDSIS